MASNPVESAPVLPTLDRLNATKVHESVNASAIAREWLSAFSEAQNTKDIETLFLPDASWRDILALTSDIRSLNGWAKIKALLDSRRSHLTSLRLLEEPHNVPAIDNPFPDLTLLLFSFEFEVPIGRGSGIGRLVPTSDGKWKAYTIFTCLDSLKNNVEKVGVNRSWVPIVEPWEELRKRQIDFVDSAPDVIIIGGGQAGLEVAAHLKLLDVPALVLERSPRIGDSWRNRYDSLALHDTVWYDHMPYLPFPTSWPVYPSAGKLANWLEAYAETLELSVWTSSEILKITWDDATKTWSVTIRRGTNEPRTFNKIKHVVFTTGFGGGVLNMPDVPNQDKFKGNVFHSATFKSAREFSGKKAIVVGACNSGHDVAQDFLNHGVDVTMYQRSPTYVISAKAIAGLLGGLFKEGTNLEYADRVNASLPYGVVKLLHQRITPHLAKAFDKGILDGLEKVGFMTDLGPDDAGIFPLLLTRGGGYYIDTGGSQDIIDGKIKLKTGSTIKSYTENGLEFEDGIVLGADVIVFATGFGDATEAVKAVCGSEVTSKLLPIWGLDEEGELNSVWKSSGHEGLWIGIGNLAMCRFYSGVLALQIKANIDGILPPKF